MATPTKPVTVLQRCSVAPAPCSADGDAVEQQQHTLPLTFLDVIWLYFHPIERLLCYHYPSCSTADFLEIIAPNLKTSLSQTLKYYLPVAGNLYHPLESNPGLPELKYTAGDSISVTFAVSREDFDFSYLTGDHPRSADDFHSFVPDLPEPRIESNSGFQVIPLIAIQVTLVPEKGLCIGITNHHVLGDASSVVGFIKAWSSTSRLGNLPDSHHLLPLYDRSVIPDPSGRANIFWSQMKQSKFGFWEIKFPIDKVRATFTLQKSEIEKLRKQVYTELDPSGSYHLSSFTIAAAYVWTCLVKSSAEAGEVVGDDEPECFGLAVDARKRLDPPVPDEYFGNCVAFVVVESRHGTLKGENGFTVASKMVGELIAERVNNTTELWRDADDWIVKYAPYVNKRVFGVSGSPRFDLYEADFGWGKAIKYECVSIDMDKSSMSLCKSREFEGGLEIGMTLPERKMRAFAAAFRSGKMSGGDD